MNTCNTLQGHKLGMHQSKNVHSEPLQSPQTNSTCIEQAYSPETMSGKSHASYSYPSAVDWTGQSISSELEGSVGLADPEISSLVQLFQLPPPDPSSHSDIGAGKNCSLLVDCCFLLISVQLLLARLQFFLRIFHVYH